MNGLPTVAQALAMYAAGWFPMDDEEAAELPWYAAHERALLALDQDSRAALAHKLRRSLRACADHELVLDRDHDAVLDLCATPPDPADGVWITPRLKALYRALHQAGAAHSFELRAPDGSLAAGILAVTIGRAALLESMRHLQSHAGNALLSRTLDHLAGSGYELCDIQLLSEHTERLGARLVARDEFDLLLAGALAPR